MACAQHLIHRAPQHDLDHTGMAIAAHQDKIAGFLICGFKHRLSHVTGFFNQISFASAQSQVLVGTRQSFLWIVPGILDRDHGHLQTHFAAEIRGNV